jgi:hypothetical protein
MHDKPDDLAKRLVQEHGIYDAQELATAEIATAQENGDNYALSVWREVRQLLREREKGSHWSNSSREGEAADTNWHIVRIDDEHKRIMLDPDDSSKPYFIIYSLGLTGDSNGVQFVYQRWLLGEKSVLIDYGYFGRCSKFRSHAEAIRHEIKKRGLPELDIDLSRI